MTTHDAKRLRLVAESIARAFRDGVWRPGPMSARAAHDLSVEWKPWLEDLAGEVVAASRHRPDGAPRWLAGLVADRLVESLGDTSGDEVLDWICRRDDDGAYGARRIAGPIVAISMGPRPWSVPVIDDVADLARFLGTEPNELAWYADVKSLERTVRSENLRHYDYRWLPTRRGGERLIEAPKQNLKAMQRKVLHSILDPVPPHDAAHGFRPDRSIQTYAAGHTAKDLVVRLDLRAFFTSVSAGRVFGIFKTAGYPEDVAHSLTGLTTNTVPPAILKGRSTGSMRTVGRRLRSPHLPQGAPTSPALANLAAFGIDRRLSELARRFDATYTRYADDLAVSGGDELGRGIDRFLDHARAIVDDEGFAINERKTSLRYADQRQTLTGLVVNRHLNVHRRDYDRLRAVLHDAALNGPTNANRASHPSFRAHLEGRIGFVQATNPARARKLWRMFDLVSW